MLTEPSSVSTNNLGEWVCGWLPDGSNIRAEKKAGRMRRGLNCPKRPNSGRGSVFGVKPRFDRALNTLSFDSKLGYLTVLFAQTSRLEIN